MKRNDERRARKPRLLRTLTALAAGAALAGAPTAAAFAGEPSHGAYTWHHFANTEGGDRTDGLDSITFEITVDTAPGDQANVYWSNQFGFLDSGGTHNNGGAYTGMQSNENREVNQFLFSLWDATEAKPGSEGSYCVEFAGEGEGMSCRYDHNWREGDRYQFTVAQEGNGWFGVAVDNLDDPDIGFTLGSIRTRDGQTKLSPIGMVSWTEYFEHGATCTNQPFAQATFKNPVTAPATIAKQSGLTPRTECGASTVVRTEDGSIQRTGIGFPAKGGNSKQPPPVTEAAPESEKPGNGTPDGIETDTDLKSDTDPDPECDTEAEAAPPRTGDESTAPPTSGTEGIPTMPEHPTDEAVIPLVTAPAQTAPAETVSTTSADALAKTGSPSFLTSAGIVAALAAGAGGLILVAQRIRTAAAMKD